MTLNERIKSDALKLRKAGVDKVAISLLVTLNAEIVKTGKDAGNREATDEEAVAVIRKFASNAKQTLENLKGTSIEKEKSKEVQHELDILSNYLPDSIDETTIETAVAEILNSMDGPPYEKSAIGIVMKSLKEKFGVAFDGKTFSPVVKRMVG